MSDWDRARALRAFERSEAEWRRWLDLWQSQADRTLEAYGRWLRGPRAQPSLRETWDIALGWYTLPWRALDPRRTGGRNGDPSPTEALRSALPFDPPSSRQFFRPVDFHELLAHRARRFTDYYVDASAASMLRWARLLGCDTPEDRLRFDQHAEMVGPAGWTLVEEPPEEAPEVTNLELDGDDQCVIPARHVVVRVNERRVIVSIVDLYGLQKDLLPGDYTGDVRFSDGQCLRISARRQ